MPASRHTHYAKILLLSVVCLFLIGTCGYIVLEGISPLEALYLTVGTLTTVAPFELTDGGRLFAVVLIISGFGLVAATAAFLGNTFLEGNAGDTLIAIGPQTNMDRFFEAVYKRKRR
mgnify:CR=1 FL=1